MFYDMLLLQTVLDVSEPPWTAVVLRSSVFAQQTRRQKMYRTYIFYRACGCFLCAPSICIVYFKRLTEKGFFQNGQGCPWFHAEATFLLRKNSRPEVYTDVHFWTVYFKRLTEEYALRYAVAAKKLILNVSEPPWTAVVLRRSEFACELVAHECTGRTFVGEDVRGSTQ